MWASARWSPLTIALCFRNRTATTNPRQSYKPKQPPRTLGARCSHSYLSLRRWCRNIYEPHQRGQPLLRWHSSQIGQCDRSCYKRREKLWCLFHARRLTSQIYYKVFRRFFPGSPQIPWPSTLIWPSQRLPFPIYWRQDDQKNQQWMGQGGHYGGRKTLVKSVLTLQAIYSLMPFIIPQCSLHFFTKSQRAYLLAASDKVPGAKCKVNWNTVCHPTALGDLGILDIDKFSRAWVDPCSKLDIDVFYSMVNITTNDGETASFWHSPWLQGSKPKDLAPDIFSLFARKNCSVSFALQDNAWIKKINMENGFFLAHFLEFVELWSKLQHIQLFMGFTTLLNGNSPKMEFTPHPWHTKCNFPVSYLRTCHCWFGEVVLHQKSSSWLGSFYRIVFGRQIDFKGGDNQTIWHVQAMQPGARDGGTSFIQVPFHC